MLMVPTKGNRFSFTLIELLVVIAVLGILAGVAGPNLKAGIVVKMSKII